MPDDRTIGKLVDEHDGAALTAADPAEIAAYVLEVLADQEGWYPANDADGLISLGVTLFLAGQQRVDLVATEWLARQRSLVRLEIVCTLLIGVWRSGRAMPAVHPDALREIIDAHAALAADAPFGPYRLAIDYAVTATEDSAEPAAALARQAQADLD